MKYLKDSYVYAMDKDNPPAITVEPGESIQVETLDAFGGGIESEADGFEKLEMDRVNPATGPIAVEGAEPGDTLKVKIKDIELNDQGVQGIVPGFGFLSERFSEPVVTLHRVSEGKISFGDKELKIDPMIGTIGVAPEGEAVPCNTPGPHGGNLDTIDVGPGATLFFPVFQQGALLSLGDAHAAQGDGEVCGVGIEIGTVTTLKVDVAKRSIETPRIETDERFMTLGSGETLEGAGKIALEAMIDYLSSKTDLSETEAYKFCSVAADMRISQVVNPLRTVRVIVPKKYL